MNRFDYSISYTEAHGHALVLAQKAAADNFDFVFAVGGDGTVNQSASGIINSKTTLGIIPTGSGNGLARHLKIPFSHQKALDLINQQTKIRIDGGVANGKLFFCTAGIGFDAHVGKIFAQSTRRGFNTYFRTALKEFFGYTPQSYTIKTGETEFKKSAFSITLANASQFGNNAYISPEADISDGLLDLCIVKVYPKTQAINMAISLFNKSLHKNRYVEIHKVKSVDIETKEANCFHCDGEHLELNDVLKIEVVPSCLSILVPGIKN
jgi:YegS/Rv2252/BmrU family lipid kinase